MNKEKEKPALSGVERLVPALRFPEFVNDGDWEEKKLGNIANIVTGTTPKTSEPENYGGNKLFVSPADISGKRYISKTIKTLSEVGFSKSRIISENSILFVCIGSTIGKIAQNKIECATNQQINSLIPFEYHSDDFIYSLLENNSSRIASLAGHQAVPLINKTDFSEILVLLPPTKLEQQKIANCLSSLDTVITAETEKLAHLKDHKKGLLQQLFPANGESKPQYRFPEFVGDGDWEEVELGNYCSITTGKLDANAMVEKGKYRFYTCARNFYRIDDFAFDTEALLVSGNGANVGYIHYYKGKFNAYQRTYVLDQFRMNIHYLKYNLEYNLSKRISLEKKEGNTPYIVKSTLSEMKIILPKNPKEQQQIANCFSSVDDLIEAQTIKIETLKDHKKGLMQQLFPNVKKHTKALKGHNIIRMGKARSNKTKALKG